MTAVNHYLSELSIEKAHKKKLDDKQRKHLAMLEVNKYEHFFKNLNMILDCK